MGKRFMNILASLGLGVLAMGVLTACGTDAGTSGLEQQVAALQTQVGELEAQLRSGQGQQAGAAEQPAISVLHDLGRAFGFTPFRQGEYQVLVVPARDEWSRPTVVVTGADVVPVRTEDADPGTDQDGDEEGSDRMRGNSRP